MHTPGKPKQRDPARPCLFRLLALIFAFAILLTLDPAAKRSHPAQAQPAPINTGRGALPARPGLTSEEAYFQFDYPPYPDTFIFKLTDPAKIQEARDILSGQPPNHHVMGTIMKAPADYNPPWSYQLDPASITFFSSAIEVCDATIQYVEEHLAQVGGSFLPGSIWCPWGSRLIAEVQFGATPTPTNTPTNTPTHTPTQTPTHTHTPTPANAPAALVYLPVVAR
jgi:hypothetical protein